MRCLYAVLIFFLILLENFSSYSPQSIQSVFAVDFPPYHLRCYLIDAHKTDRKTKQTRMSMRSGKKRAENIGGIMLLEMYTRELIWCGDHTHTHTHSITHREIPTAWRIRLWIKYYTWKAAAFAFANIISIWYYMRVYTFWISFSVSVLKWSDAATAGIAVMVLILERNANKTTKKRRSILIRFLPLKYVAQIWRMV